MANWDVPKILAQSRCASDLPDSLVVHAATDVSTWRDRCASRSTTSARSQRKLSRADLSTMAPRMQQLPAENVSITLTKSSQLHLTGEQESATP